MLSFLQNSKSQADLINSIIIYSIIIVLVSFILRYFWNNALVKHITILKPIKTLLDSLMLSIGLSLVM